MIHRGEHSRRRRRRRYLPNYREFYEKRHFAVDADTHRRCDPRLRRGRSVRRGEPCVRRDDNPDFTFHVEICEDFWAPLPPSTFGALAGATVLFNLSASNIVIGKAEDRAMLCDAQSRRAIGGLRVRGGRPRRIAPPIVAWDGQVVAYEMGEKIAEGERFAREPKLVIADIDVARIAQERRRIGDLPRRRRAPQGRARPLVAACRFTVGAPSGALPLKRKIDRLPFVPDDLAQARSRLLRSLQHPGLRPRASGSKRHGSKRVVIGVSGGLEFHARADRRRARVRSARPAAQEHCRRHHAGLRHQRRHQGATPGR